NKEKIHKHWPIEDLLKLKWMAFSRGQDFVQDTLEQEFRPVFITYTTGTTNLPIPYLYTGRDMNNLCISGSRMLNLFDIKRSENIGNMFPSAPHLSFWQEAFAGVPTTTMI